MQVDGDLDMSGELGVGGALVFGVTDNVGFTCFFKLCPHAQ